MSPRAEGTPSSPLPSRGAALAVFRKETLDALRDRRTLLVVLASGVLVGPLVLLALALFQAAAGERADRREILVWGIEAAPSLRDYLERKAFTPVAAPADHEDQLRAGSLSGPVVVVPRGFEAALQAGETPVVEVVGDSTGKQAEGAAEQVDELLSGFSRERAVQGLALRGVPAQVLEPVRLKHRDLASPRARAAQLASIVPFFVLIAVLYGALNAALDTTAGERERGSLEPLLMNPARRVDLVLGKWGAVACVSMLIALLSCLSFVPGRWLLESDDPQALFPFGWREVLLFQAVLLPFAAALSALLMAVAIRCRSFKEAQANSTLIMLALSLMPLATMFDPGEPAWHLWVPALAQNALMARVLKGEGFGAEQVLVPLGVCVALTAACIWFVARMLRQAAVK
jgi:sodium transport system permease protein